MKVNEINIGCTHILKLLLAVLFFVAGSSLTNGSVSLLDTKKSEFDNRSIGGHALQYILPEKLCNWAYETLPQCVNLGEQCEGRYSSSYLPGAPRGVIAALQSKKGFNVNEFDKFCYRVCLNAQINIRYKEFRANACRVKN